MPGMTGLSRLWWRQGQVSRQQDVSCIKYTMETSTTNNKAFPHTQCFKHRRNTNNTHTHGSARIEDRTVNCCTLNTAAHVIGTVVTEDHRCKMCEITWLSYHRGFTCFHEASCLEASHVSAASVLVPSWWSICSGFSLPQKHSMMSTYSLCSRKSSGLRKLLFPDS